MTTPSLLCASRPSFHARLIVALASLLVLLLGLGAPRLALAQPAETKPAPNDIKSRYIRAVALYNSGQYDKAIEEFQGVYEMRPEPILLFNLAQAHRKAGHKAPALDLYERFLRESQDPDPKLKSETETYVTELRASIAADKENEKAAAEKAAAEKAAAEKAAADKAAADKAAADKAAAIARRRSSPTRPLNIAKWALLGVGVAMIVAGGVLMGVDGRPVCTDDMPMMPGQKLCPNELDTKVTGGAVLGVGIAALGGSAALFVVDYKQTREAPKSSLVALNLNF